MSNTFTLIEESVKISLCLVSFGWSKEFILILMCSGFMKIRSLKSPLDCIKNACHKSLSFFPDLSELKISRILAAYLSWLPSPELGTLRSLQCRTAKIIICIKPKNISVLSSDTHWCNWQYPNFFFMIVTLIHKYPI